MTHTQAQLEPFQIRKMARPYSDAQLVKQGQKQLVTGEGFWSNGYAAFYGEEPSEKIKSIAHHIADVTESFLDWMREEFASSFPVRPVEIVPAPVTGDKKRVLMRFANCRCAGWVNGRYVSAVLKRYKEKDVGHVQWHAFSKGIMASFDGELVAVIMGVYLNEEGLERLQNTEWSLKVS